MQKFLKKSISKIDGNEDDKYEEKVRRSFTYLPKYNMNAESDEAIFDFSDLLPENFDQNFAVKKISKILEKKAENCGLDEYPSFLREIMSFKDIKSDKAPILLYLKYLIRAFKLHRNEKEIFKFIGCPNNVGRKLIDRFKLGRDSDIKHRKKLFCHILVISMFLVEFKMNLREFDCLKKDLSLNNLAYFRSAIKISGFTENIVEVTDDQNDRSKIVISVKRPLYIWDSFSKPTFKRTRKKINF
ncbi:hypothetical protein MHBO_001819 [Bonamia ostreae]|uniref:Uncharacterized protein n=1 Tax=Bonamia ostreae TaxID=126728 RepID=A0ABV2AKA1_9EUKA